MGQYRKCFSSGVRDYVFWCIMKRRWSWSGLGDVYTLICELIETWQFYPWFVEIGAVICGVTVQFLLLSTVVDDDPFHCWFFLAPISPFLLVGVQEGIRDLFGACLVAEIIEVRTLLFFDLWLRLLVFFLFWGAHNIEIYISGLEWRVIYRDMRPEREYIEGPTIKGMIELGLIVRWYIYHLLFCDDDLDFFMIIG